MHSFLKRATFALALLAAPAFADPAPLNIQTVETTGGWALKSNGAYYAESTSACPAGSTLIGGGVYCDTAGGTSTRFAEHPNGNGLYGACANIGNPKSGKGVRVQARCLVQGDPAPISVVMRQATGFWKQQSNGWYAEVTAACPDGYKAAGGGGTCMVSAGVASQFAGDPNGTNAYYAACAVHDNPGRPDGVLATVWCMK